MSTDNDLKTLSKKNYISTFDSNPSIDELNLGCMQRIANATELMSKNYLELQRVLERYQQWYKNERERNERLNKTITNLERVKTRYKNQVKKLKEANKH